MTEKKFTEKGYIKLINKLLLKVDEKIESVLPKLKKAIQDPDKLEKAIEFHRAILIIQYITRVSMMYMKQHQIEPSICISVSGEDLDDDKSLIGNYALMLPESFEELDYHMSFLLSFLEARESGWKPGLHTFNELKNHLKKTEDMGKEYEKFIVRGKL